MAHKKELHIQNWPRGLINEIADQKRDFDSDFLFGLCYVRPSNLEVV